ncbi:hypothetical protein SEA_SKOG_69 [Gordonia phage Skog]|uniref:Uncharacterized protein n=1 Tax=Gordonia phage Skog TaxID=2704033 RepID=A0A6G6XJD5_9CAUD|nr:hypothetical protein KHQ85_gp069 [Gordonia phage Skog]QIG58221.1 hypothetical protein SEA_SKOG_69 [Gordonia phage Skog]
MVQVHYLSRRSERLERRVSYPRGSIFWLHHYHTDTKVYTGTEIVQGNVLLPAWWDMTGHPEAVFAPPETCACWECLQDKANPPKEELSPEQAIEALTDDLAAVLVTEGLMVTPEAVAQLRVAVQMCTGTGE